LPRCRSTIEYALSGDRQGREAGRHTHEYRRSHEIPRRPATPCDHGVAFLKKALLASPPIKQAIAFFMVCSSAMSEANEVFGAQYRFRFFLQGYMLRAHVHRRNRRTLQLLQNMDTGAQKPIFEPG